MKSLFSLREIAQELDIPKSTVVKYKDYFAEFLPLRGEGKRKKFDQVTLDVMRRVRDLREKENLDWSEIRAELGKEYTKAKADSPSPEPQRRPQGAEVVPLQTESGQKLDYLVNLVYAFAGEVTALRKTVEGLSRSAEKTAADPVLQKSLLVMHRHVALLEKSQKGREAKAAELISDLARSVSEELSRMRAEVRAMTPKPPPTPPEPVKPAARPDLIAKLKRQQEVLLQVKEILDRQVETNRRQKDAAGKLIAENNALKGKNKALAQDIAQLKRRIAEIERERLTGAGFGGAAAPARGQDQIRPASKKPSSSALERKPERQPTEKSGLLSRLGLRKNH